MMNSDQFDWAVLAQQWIQKNSCMPDNSDNSSEIPEPPPPPIISENASNVSSNNKNLYEEQGEADMEVVDDEDNIQLHLQQNFSQINDGGMSHQFSGHSSNIPPPVWFGPPQNQQIPYCNPWNQWQTPGNVTIPPPQLHIPPVRQINIMRENQLQPIPPLLKTPGSQNEDTTPIIDAAKRKTLPAWIREGLEKMEREKLKEKEKHNSTTDKIETKKSQWSDDDDNNIYNIKNEEDPTVGSNTMKSSNDIKVIVKSSPANSDSEDSENNSQSFLRDEREKHLSPKIQIIKKPIKSYDEIMEELMLVVRKSLTEVLLEVTTEEIQNISQETFKKHKLKASSAQVFRKSAISSITGKLGLGAYADSESDDSNSDNSDDENGKNSDQEKNSEDELREQIRIRQNSFKAIAQEIESAVSHEEAYKEQKSKERRSLERSHHSSKGSYSVDGCGSSSSNNNPSSSTSKKYCVYDKDFGETQQTDKKSLSNGKRPKERTSRFSDNKDSRHKSTSSSSHYLVPTSMISSNAPPSTSSTSQFLVTKQRKLSSLQNVTDNDEKLKKLSSSRNKKLRSNSNSSSSSLSSSNDSKSNSRHHKRRHRHDSERSSSSYKKSSRNYLNDNYKKNISSNSSSSRRKRSNHDDDKSSESDDYRQIKNDKTSKTEKKANRNKSRSRSKSRSTSIRSRSRSQSRSSYSSSRRYERY